MKLHPVTIFENETLEDSLEKIRPTTHATIDYFRKQILLDSEKDWLKWYKQIAELGEELADSVKDFQKNPEHKMKTFDPAWTQIAKLRYDAMIRAMKILEFPPTSIQIAEKMWKISKPHMQQELQIYPEIL